MKPLHVAFVWHMHQPYYKDDLTNTYLLPWVRLRSAKDYYKMPALLDAYPKVRATFNLVPSLLAQIEDYGKADSVDFFLNLSSRDAEDLTARNGLCPAVDARVPRRSVPAVAALLELASRPIDAQFTTADMRDLQVWFNLAWCDPAWAESDPRLAELKRKDHDFTELDKLPLFEAQAEIMQLVIPKYRELADRGQAELTFSPYYHPILPLLCHVDSARTASPHLQLPERHFSHREDAERQIELGQGLFERLVGRKPVGMWPDGGGRRAVVGLAVKSGIDWMISDADAGALARRACFSERLYQPHRVDREGRSGWCSRFRAVQRDRLRLPADVSIDAAKDLIGRLQRIREQQEDRDFLAVIALDGENAWEFYPRDGHDSSTRSTRSRDVAGDRHHTVTDFQGAPGPATAAPPSHRELDRRA